MTAISVCIKLCLCFGYQGRQLSRVIWPQLLSKANYPTLWSQEIDQRSSVIHSSLVKPKGVSPLWWNHLMHEGQLKRGPSTGQETLGALLCVRVCVGHWRMHACGQCSRLPGCLLQVVGSRVEDRYLPWKGESKTTLCSDCTTQAFALKLLAQPNCRINATRLFSSDRVRQYNEGTDVSSY